MRQLRCLSHAVRLLHRSAEVPPPIPNRFGHTVSAMLVQVNDQDIAGELCEQADNILVYQRMSFSLGRSLFGLGYFYLLQFNAGSLDSVIRDSQIILEIVFLLISAFAIGYAYLMPIGSSPD